MSSDFTALGLRRVIEPDDAIVARKCKKPAEIVKAAGARKGLWTGIRIYAFKPVLKLLCGLILKKRGWEGGYRRKLRRPSNMTRFKGL